jgi:3-ketosteroid 9alpha-monooxygenase subunit B
VPEPYHRVRVAEVIEETPDARSLVLDLPPALGDRFAYQPGQFLTVRIPGGVARCYSLSSSPHTDTAPKITVKRVVDGYASNWICDHVAPGSELELLVPAGQFVPPALDGDLLLLAGGSGITPVISIIKSALALGRGHLALLYANRDRRSVIFAAELGRLAEQHPDRLHVSHWFDAEQGPPTAATLEPLLRPYAARDAFACGPEPYLAVACRALRRIGMPAARIHVERFQSGSEADAVPADPHPDDERIATAEVELDGQTHRMPWPARTRLLDLLIAGGLNPPYSCRQGTCGACACRVVKGEVELLHNEVLEEEDFAEGYTLACQALPRTDEVGISYS